MCHEKKYTSSFLGKKKFGSVIRATTYLHMYIVIYNTHITKHRGEMDAVDDILEKLSTHLRDDGQNLSKLKICCVKCQGEISDKVVTTPGGKTFHLEHFTCVKCSRVKIIH